MAQQALILHPGQLGPRELRLGRILDFFGVPWQSADPSQFSSLKNADRYAAFGSARVVAGVLEGEQEGPMPAALYVYADEKMDRSESAVGFLLGDPGIRLADPPQGDLFVSVSAEQPGLTGPMSGLGFLSKLTTEDSIVAGTPRDGQQRFRTVVSAGDAAVFLRFERRGAPIFFSASSHIPDIEEPISQGFYDVKSRFCSVVPLVMFIKFSLSEAVWHSQEHNACLIIDDPLLSLRYASCDFKKLRDMMAQHRFTTNIAFIPWNWRRTTAGAADFFNKESAFFSVSIHGCDHTAGEFGATSPVRLHSAARLAQTRMRGHQLRTGIHHDPVMVFPQGVFSSACPGILKQHGFLAAVNTEVAPADSTNTRTVVRDLWDVAIMAYGRFPIFTRRYPSHGLENFAFDALLGKPCLIVTHQDFFQDSGANLLELVNKLHSLKLDLVWRSLGEVIRRACRRRISGSSVHDVEMYGSELQIQNSSDESIYTQVRKLKEPGDRVAEVLCDNTIVAWESDDRYFSFGLQIAPGDERRIRVVYRSETSPEEKRSIRYEVSVAARRILSELRDKCSFLPAALQHVRPRAIKPTAQRL